MPNNNRNRNRRPMAFMRDLLARQTNAPIEQQLHLMASLRSESPEVARDIDRFLLEEYRRLSDGIKKTQQNQEKLKEVFKQLSAPPWYPAVYMRPVPTTQGQRALVKCASTARVVAFSDGVSQATLSTGDVVLLNNGLNAIMAKSPNADVRSGEIALFDRKIPDGRIVLKWRNEEVIVEAAKALTNGCELKRGDQIQWDRTLWIALEKIERPEDGSLFLEKTPAETFDNIGGLDDQINLLRTTVELHLNHKETVNKYRLPPVQGILLVGPPGTGKTMLVRAFANWLATLSPSGRCRFMNIKPGKFNSMWFGQSEENCRETFEAAREAGEKEPDVPVVMFFDELDSIGTVRGTSLGRIHDRVMQAFMAELDGLESRGNILVVAATNRVDAIDPALSRPGRLGDLTIEVPKPNMAAAGEIFGKYFHSDIPYHTNGHNLDQATARKRMVHSAVSAIFSPNGDRDLSIIIFRDGNRRTVKSVDLVSGAVIKKIANKAIADACLRDIKTGQSGLMLKDVLTSIHEEFESAASVLTPFNCRNYIANLPQDVDIMSVERIEKNLRKPHRYLNLSVA